MKKIMKRKGFTLNKIKKNLGKLALSAMIVFIAVNKFCIETFATGGIASSKLATGFQKLVNDGTIWLTVIAIPVTVFLVVFFAIRKGAADEQDQKMWQKRITTALVCGIGVILASSVVNVISGYFM